jgi:molybdenum cofactor cytidylyltransferase
VIVVLGANSAPIAPEIEHWSVETVWNPNWQSGKSTSIQAGIRALSSSPAPFDAAVLMTCDQPHVDTALLNAILDRHRILPESIIACEYSGTTGVPALIPQKYFEELMQLTGDEGAKALIAAHSREVQTVSFPEGGVDIDTLPDLNMLRLR